MTHRLRLALASTLVALLGLGTVAPPVAADATTDAATAWLAARQEPDGGFEVADFAPFETPDVILAIAAGAQSGTPWSTGEALAAVQALDANGAAAGGTPLDWADEYLTANPPTAGIAAKFIVLVAGPLGLDPAAFDPSGNGAVDLVAAMDAGKLPDGSYSLPAINDTLYALLAHDVIGRDAPTDTLAYLRGAQQANGGWSYDGAPEGTDTDVDTTARAVQALVASGVPTGDGTVAAALKYLADLHQASGAWQFFGSDDTNSTAMAAMAIHGAGWRLHSSCWRTSSSSGAAGPYTNPVAWLRSQQVTSGEPADLGRFLSQNDVFSEVPNTSATSQAVQALLRSWLPLSPAPLARTEDFDDVPACAWYSQAVAWMAENGITRFAGGTFGPKSGITNGQLSLLLWNLFDQPGPFTDHPYTNVAANAAYNDALDWLLDAGLINDGTTFPSKRNVNRARVLNLLWQLAGSPAGAPDLAIADVSDTAPFADAVDWAIEHGIAQLLPDGTFRPRQKVTRAQAALMMFRLASTQPAWGEVALPSTVEF
ncbi:MAG: S-layer homology domain-containing protein [Acidimicrobiales bacterium]|nr:S-layer homology domain-containing protein [Acidimicrobiales bacterium]MCB9372642.1 S-layer homology domain-containing protein [Microthrixaceae bacterium]